MSAGAPNIEGLLRCGKSTVLVSLAIFSECCGPNMLLTGHRYESDNALIRTLVGHVHQINCTRVCCGEDGAKLYV